MAQIIPQEGGASAIGRGFGSGLSEQIPKEIDRYRLSQGLKQFEKESANLTPIQQLSRLSSIPGITPQMIQSFGELARQQARGQALAKENAPKPSPFPQNQIDKQLQPSSKIPSLTEKESFERAQKGYIPPAQEDIDAIAGQAFNANPAFFANDPERAIKWAHDKVAQEEKIALAYQAKHQNLSNIQDNVVNRLGKQYTKLTAGGKTSVPADLYSKIEDEAIQATKPESLGGRGLTEQQAMKEYGDKLLDADKQFNKINEVGDWQISLRESDETLRSMKNIQKEMEKLDQTDNFAKQLISVSKLSPKLAYAIAERVSRIPKLNSYIKNLPIGNKTETLFQTVYDKEGTYKIAPELAKFVKENEKASPLAIAYEIEKKGYDPAIWLQYLTDHANELNLRSKQSEQASTPFNLMDPWNDWWLSSFTGIE